MEELEHTLYNEKILQMKTWGTIIILGELLDEVVNEFSSTRQKQLEEVL